MEPGVQQGLGYAVVALVSFSVGKLFDFLSARVSSRLSAVEAAAKACEEKHAQCEEERAKDKAELERRDEEDRQEWKAEIESLKKQLAKQVKSSGS